MCNSDFAKEARRIVEEVNKNYASLAEQLVKHPDIQSLANSGGWVGVVSMRSSPS